MPAFVRERPASYAAFDLLAVAGHDIRAVPLTDRRAFLEELASNWAAPLTSPRPPRIVILR
jgi:ATP-dependent DNA ligase